MHTSISESLLKSELVHKFALKWVDHVLISCYLLNKRIMYCRSISMVPCFLCLFVCFFFSRLGFLNRWTEKEIDEPRSTTFATYPFFVQQSLELGILKNFFFAFAYKEMRTRLGWTVSYKSLYFVHPSLDLVPLFTRMRERSIAAEFTLKQKYEAVTVLCNYRSEYSKNPRIFFQLSRNSFS